MRTLADSLFMPSVQSGCSPLRKIVPWQRWGQRGGIDFNRATLESRDHLILADNLTLLEFLPDSCVDLIYIDPPFATGKRRESPQGDDGPDGFEDSWDNPDEFVAWLAPRLTHLWRILSESGSIIIHLDTRAVHNVRVWCDENFGQSNWENEIIWHYTGGGRSRKRFSRKHDVLLWYSKSPKRIFNIDAIREPYEPTSGYAKGGIVSKKGKKYMPHPDGKPADDVWDIPIVNPMSSERTPYPTQKPLRLIKRIVAALSSEGQVVMDAFSGSGTTALACRNLGRRFICCDDNPDAIGITLERLHEKNHDTQQPAVVSYGMYRMMYADDHIALKLASRLVSEGLRIQADEPPAIIRPSWSDSNNPPFPLNAGDAIVDIRSLLL